MCRERDSVPSDMVAFRSQHSSAEPGFIQERFATTQYQGTMEKLTPREGVTPPGWHAEFTKTPSPNVSGLTYPAGVGTTLLATFHQRCTKHRLTYPPPYARSFRA